MSLRKHVMQYSPIKTIQKAYEDMLFAAYQAAEELSKFDGFIAALPNNHVLMLVFNHGEYDIHLSIDEVNLDDASQLPQTIEISRITLLTSQSLKEWEDVFTQWLALPKLYPPSIEAWVRHMNLQTVTNKETSMHVQYEDSANARIHHAVQSHLKNSALHHQY